MGCNGGLRRVWQQATNSDNRLLSLIFRAVVPRFGGGEANKDCQMPKTETELMLKGYGLTTAELYYRLPDYRNVINSFIWQEYDLAPDYPELFRFIEYWQGNIEGPLHSVRFTHRKLIAPGEWRNVVGEFRLH
jgi:uncharacterized protein Usg